MRNWIDLLESMGASAPDIGTLIRLRDYSGRDEPCVVVGWARPADADDDEFDPTHRIPGVSGKHLVHCRREQASHLVLVRPGPRHVRVVRVGEGEIVGHDTSARVDQLRRNAQRRVGQMVLTFDPSLY